MGRLSRLQPKWHKLGRLKLLFPGKIPQTLTVSDQINAARDCELIELEPHEFTTAKLGVEPGREYNIFLKVVSTSTRRDAAMLTFLVDVALTPDEAVKYFPRFTTAVGKPFAFIPNQSEEQNEGLTSVRFTAPPEARFLSIGARRWARDGDVKIGRCLTMEPEGAAAVRTIDCELPGGKFCELVINAGGVAHLSAVAVFTMTLTFRDPQRRPLPEGSRVVRCVAYPGASRAVAALPLPIEVPADAVTIGASIACSDEQLLDLVQITLQACAQPVEATAFLSAVKDRLDRRAAAIRVHASEVASGEKETIDDWLCSEKAGVLHWAAALFRPGAESSALTSRHTTSLPVTPGTILEIRLLPVLVAELAEPCAATLTASFFDANGKTLPHAGHQQSWSHWTRSQYPLSFVEEGFDQQTHFVVPHYIVAPPHATTLAVEVRGAVGFSHPTVLADAVTVYDNETARLVQRVIAYLDERSRFLSRLARCLPIETEKSILSAAAAEHESCMRHLRLLQGFLLLPTEPRVWRAASAVTSFDIEGLPRRLPEPDPDAPMPASSDTKLCIGVIGSKDFIYYLSVWHDVTPLTPDTMRLAAGILPLDLVVLQQSDRPAGGWPTTFFGFLDGVIPPSTLELVRSLRKRGVPVVLVADPSPAFLRLTANWTKEVDRLVISGPGAEDKKVAAALGDRPNFVRFPLLVELQLHRPVIEERQPAFGVLYSSFSDLFDFQDNLLYLERILDAGLVLADRHWRLAIERAKENLQAPELAERVFGSASTEQWAFLCRHAAVALFFEDSLMPRYKAAQCMAEAIANGAVVVYVGDPSQLGELADSVIGVDTPYHLSLVLRQLRFGWHREQVWLRAFRRLHHQSRFERLATWLRGVVVPNSPVQPVVPKATMITISKRPHLLDYCLDKFRRQTYPNLELVLVLNADIDDAALEEASTADPRVRIYKAPKELNIGYCLNMAIAAASGHVWLKCDDDDFYGPHYVEDMVNTFYFSGADIVGKPQWYTYFEDQDAMYIRIVGRERERSVLRPGTEFLTGATLSASKEATEAKGLWFSSSVRMANDSEWTLAAIDKGIALFYADRNNFAIYRSADVKNHTWVLSNDILRARCQRLVAGSRYDLIC
jgi:hypothetical protein